jgi:hypothetical protein
VLERLMNPERLAIDDGTRANAIATRVDGVKEHVLAELTGPGAVVQIEASNQIGQIACYFDGEAEPRIDCPVRDLAKHLPQVAASPGSWATFLGYESGLKIVLRDGEAGNYRIEHVALPLPTPLTSFRHAEESIARGMLPALSYRYQQMESGRVRDDDPLPRKTSSPQRIEPGTSVPLVQLDGSGTVQWWRLNVPRATLDNDDLWIDITIDGESQPAISAPARFLFPGMKGGRGYRNFVVTNYQGFVNRLALPFGNGLSIVATNHGTEALTSIGASVSYSPTSTAESTARLFRLRGVWQPAGDGTEPVFSQQGRGRLVALVCQPPPSGGAAVELVVDGSPRTSAEPTTLAQWLHLPADGDDLRTAFCGRHGGLVWRFFQLAPVDFNQAIELRQSQGEAAGARLALFYVAP